MTPADQALKTLLEKAQVMKEVIELPLELSLGCYLAEDIRSEYNVPPEDNSAMDGYAFCAEDWDNAEQTWEVSQRIPAGFVGKQLAEKTVARIFTGAEVPPGADVVVMQEECEVLEESEDGPSKIKILVDISSGENIRPKGQDIKVDQIIMRKGDRISPQAAGLLASVGVAEVNVYRPLTVALFSTGDELIEPGMVPQAGQIFNSNRYTLSAMVEAMGFEFIDLGIVPDNFQATQDALTAGAEAADVIITSGGVSVGEEDHVKAAVESLGEIELWKLAIKPGKPLTYGSVNGKPFLGLPGNPSAVFVTFCIMAWPYLLKSQGANHFKVQSLKFPANFSRHGKGKRQEYLRARLEEIDGEMKVSIFDNQSSGVLSSTVWANGLAVAPIATPIEKGELVEFVSFDQFFTV